MGQRLGIASALLGDPDTVILDEPVNGLDPEGIHWIRHLLKGLAAEGRTVFVSSHLMSEMALTADHLIVIGRGRLIADTSVNDFIELSSANRVRVRTPEAARLRELIGAEHAFAADGEPDVLDVRGLTTDAIGDLAFRNAVPLYELSTQQASLEEAFMNLTSDSVEFRSEEPDPAGVVA